MTYLITHIAIFLLFAMLLGLLLGWLLWGYVARQRGKEVQSLRKRIADLHFGPPRVAAMGQPRISLPEQTGVLIEGDLPQADTVPSSFFQDEPEEPVAEPIERLSHAAPDLEAEVKESRIQHLEQQIRELEGYRDRLQLMQADLSDAIAGRRAAENRLQETKTEFEVRSSGLAAQIRDFEKATKDWDHQRNEFERAAIAKDKELSTVKAHLRDLQNSQRPQSAEPLAPTAAALELADLRDRYQKAVQERDAIASELEVWKQNDSARSSGSAQLAQRVAELEEAGRTKDADLQEQVARIESLLWRVAELEPFSAGASGMEEDLRRQESEIAGHVAMHAEKTEQIRSLEGRIAELQAETARAEALKKQVEEHQTEIQRQAQAHAHAVGELQRTLAHKDGEIAEYIAARDEHVKVISGLQTRITDLEAEAQRAIALEKSLNDRAAEIHGLLAAHGDMHREMQSWKDYAAQLQPLASQLPALESLLSEREAEVERLKRAHDDKNAELKHLQRGMEGLSERITADRQRLRELEPLAVKAPELEQKLALQEEESRDQLKAVEERHRSELTRLKVNSAQRLRRLRQGLTNFKG